MAAAIHRLCQQALCLSLMCHDVVTVIEAQMVSQAGATALAVPLVEMAHQAVEEPIPPEAEVVRMVTILSITPFG